MTSKLSWILFIPFAAAAVFFKLAQSLMGEGSIFGLSNLALDYVVLGCAGVIFLFALIMCLIDRRISRYYQPHRNIPAGILGLLLAVVFAGDGANRLYLVFGSGKIDVLEIIEAALLLLASIVLIVMGLTHSFANRDSKNFALFNVMPALLCAIRLVRCFIAITTTSLKQADITLMFCYVFATLFFFNFAVTISLVETKHAVKSCFIFGFPAAGILLARGIFGAVTEFNASDLFANAGLAELLLMALYIFAFLVELTVFAMDRDHVAVADDGDDDEEPQNPDEDAADDYPVVSGDVNRNEEPDSSYLTTADVSDYLYHSVERPDDETEYESRTDLAGYITEEVEMEEEPEQPAPVERPAVDLTHTDDPAAYMNRLDEIDKLILELTEKSDD